MTIASTTHEQDAVPTEYRLDRRLVVKALLGAIVLVGAVCAIGFLLREPFEALSTALFARFGHAGLAGVIVAIDATPFMLPSEPLMMMAFGAGMKPWEVFVVIAPASSVGGLIGYGCARGISKVFALDAYLARRFPGFYRFMQRWGVWGIVICGMFPLPFQLSVWTAGATAVRPWWKVALACLVRFPKTAFYVWLIAAGWMLGGG